MKSYSNLWEKFIDYDNITKAMKDAALHKQKYKEVDVMVKDPDRYADAILEYAESFKKYQHEPVIIYEGVNRKKREIIAPAFPEQVIHHMIVQVLMPLFTKGLYKHTYASIPKRGLHVAAKTVIKWISKNDKNIKYFLKMDIRKFFESVDIEILEDMLKKYVKDKKFLEVVFKVLDGQKGLPLGFYTSQWFANWYLQDLDHYIKEQLKAIHYIRYMDDMVIFGPNKKELHKIREAIDKWLREKRNLQLKDNWQVCRFVHISRKDGKEKGRPLDFLGFQFYRNRIILRESLMLKATRKANKISKKDKPSIYDCRQVMAYNGFLHMTKTHKMYMERMFGKVNFKRMKKYISNYDKQHKKECKINF